MRERTSYSKFDCSAGTFLKSSVNTVTNPKAPAANHSGTAGNKKNEVHKLLPVKIILLTICIIIHEKYSTITEIASISFINLPDQSGDKP